VERKKGQRYSNEFRRQAFEQMKSCDNVLGLSRELGIPRRLLYNWRDRFEEIDPPHTRSRELTLRRQIAKLKWVLANKTLEVDFFRPYLAESRGSASSETHFWRQAIYDEIRTRMPLQGGLSVERMCQLAQVSRASFYRYLRRGWQAEEEMALRSAVQSVVIQHRWRYGYRRVTVELRTQGMVANHKRIERIMREDNLLTVREQWFRPSGHSLRVARVHLNLAGRMTSSGPNQLWAADITYVRLTREFVYLAVDPFRREALVQTRCSGSRFLRLLDWRSPAPRRPGRHCR
jgi:hypothetical protein